MRNPSFHSRPTGNSSQTENSSQSGFCLQLHFFSVYKKILYKNIEAEIGQILRIF